MSKVSIDSAREVAQWLADGPQTPGTLSVTQALLAEANRIEDAAKSLGQILYEASGLNNWVTESKDTQSNYEAMAVAVVDERVGDGSIVVGRKDTEFVTKHMLGCEKAGYGLDPATTRLLEALK